MPLPIILAGAALASAAYGAKKGYDGYQSHSEADKIVASAQQRYDEKREVFDKQETTTTAALEALGKKELEIGKRLGEFKILADKLQQKLNAGRKNKLEVNIPKHKLQEIEEYSYTAVGVLGTLAGASTAGAAAGFAVYGGVMALGAASTGTAISSLAGAAATKATLAAIGGGSLATGGMGIAGGTAILGAAVAGPVLAIAGWAYNSHGEEALRNARKADKEVNEAIEKLEQAIKHLGQTVVYVTRIKVTLASLDDQFNLYFDQLKEIDDHLQVIKSQNLDMAQELSRLDGEIMRAIENGYALATILVDLITTPIFKVKVVDGAIAMDENGVPVMETNEEGSMLLNDGELDNQLEKATTSAEAVEAA
ncbi:chemotaxis protein [Halomonas sp. ML-15]|uniref:chemotaxis protein n=1 Tax=Halomonas sp. ML-15 TaxID=2773305 RepID=UPI001746CBE7|nr:chemotaxis protein [Halomonas sp. ML-15]MBD3897907.1 chemotaxis protein [Halomonas sp. ML-15]